MNPALAKTQDDLLEAIRIDENQSQALQLLQKENDSLKQQLANQPKPSASLPTKPTVYAGLHAILLFPQDRKIPFQWIQPGNVGNTGGGSSAVHGMETWSVVPGKPTEITVAPKSIAPKSDNFFNYMVLPYPKTSPHRLRFTAGNYGAKTPEDWAKCQQLEWQIEEFRDGFQYTCAWCVNPKTGLNYWAGAKKWQPFLAGASVKSLISPSFVMCEFSLDHDAHTYTYEWITIGSTTIPAGITVPCVAAPGRKEYSISVQPDCQANASPYTVLLDNLSAEWE